MRFEARVVFIIRFNKKISGNNKILGAKTILGALPSNCSPRGYGPGFNALPDIFAVINCSVLGDR